MVVDVFMRLIFSFVTSICYSYKSCYHLVYMIVKKSERHLFDSCINKIMEQNVRVGFENSSRISNSVRARMIEVWAYYPPSMSWKSLQPAQLQDFQTNLFSPIGSDIDLA